MGGRQLPTLLRAVLIREHCECAVTELWCVATQVMITLASQLEPECGPSMGDVYGVRERGMVGKCSQANPEARSGREGV